MSLWVKVTGYVGLTCLIIASLAQIIAGIVPDYRNIGQTDRIVRWAVYLWTYASVVMGVYLMRKSGRLTECLWGIIVAFCCLESFSGLLVGVIYFFRSFVKLSKMKNGLPF